MKKLFWSNSSKSGLCDRLLDLSLISTFCRIGNFHLYLIWEELVLFGQSASESTLVYPSSEEMNGRGYIIKKYSSNRLEDYKYENFTKYFTIPNNITIISKEEVNNIRFDNFFMDYLGGMSSARTFWQKYLSNFCSLMYFLENYNKVIEEFAPTELLNDLMKDYKIPDLSVHLRRTDKVVVNPDGFAVNDTRELNVLTEQAINSYIQKNGVDVKIYFASDDTKEKEKWNNKYSEYLSENNLIDYGYINTYIDIYLLSKSHSIILSQKHSNLSVFSSLIGKNELIYLYPDCWIKEVWTPELEKFTYFDSKENI